ncbi:hypothetical protein V6767_09805 [Martelella sp. FLE1502]
MKWTPVHRPELRKNKEIEPFLVSVKRGMALVAGQLFSGSLYALVFRDPAGPPQENGVRYDVEQVIRGRDERRLIGKPGQGADQCEEIVTIHVLPRQTVRISANRFIIWAA